MFDADTLTAISLNIVALGGILAVVLNRTGVTHNTVKEVSSNIDGLTQKLKHETEPNHGTSLKDALNRIEATQRGMARDIGRLADSDIEMIHAKSQDHKVIHQRVDELTAEIQRLKEHHGQTTRR